jgi:hypothetical protein
LRRDARIIGLYLMVSGVLGAAGITSCMFDGSLPSQNADPCYQAGTFFTTPLALAPVTLDWGTAFGKADIPNSLSASLTTNIAGVTVGVSVDPDFTLRRVDNEVFVWDPNIGAWVTPEGSGDSNIHADNTYDGHFNAPGSSAQTGDGAHLLDMNGAGSYMLTFNRGINSAGLLLSSESAAFDSNFDATIQAYGQAGSLGGVGPLLATYRISTTGVGGQCDSLNNNPPVPCNDAPFIGIRAPGNIDSPQIYKIVISATSGVGNVESLALGSLQFAELAAPEPSAIFLCGAGLVLIGLLRRSQVPPPAPGRSPAIHALLEVLLQTSEPIQHQ